MVRKIREFIRLSFSQILDIKDDARHGILLLRYSNNF